MTDGIVRSTTPYILFSLTPRRTNEIRDMVVAVVCYSFMSHDNMVNLQTLDFTSASRYITVNKYPSQLDGLYPSTIKFQGVHTVIDILVIDISFSKYLFLS